MKIIKQLITISCEKPTPLGVGWIANAESVRGRINSCIRNNKKYKEHYTFIKM